MSYQNNDDYLNRKYLVCIDYKCDSPLLRSCTSEEFIELARRSKKNHPAQSFDITDVYEASTNGNNTIVMRQIPLNTLDEFVVELEWKLREKSSLQTKSDRISVGKRSN